MPSFVSLYSSFCLIPLHLQKAYPSFKVLLQKQYFYPLKKHSGRGSLLFPTSCGLSITEPWKHTVCRAHLLFCVVALISWLQPHWPSDSRIWPHMHPPLTWPMHMLFPLSGMFLPPLCAQLALFILTPSWPLWLGQVPQHHILHIPSTYYSWNSRFTRDYLITCSAATYQRKWLFVFTIESPVPEHS